MTIGFGSVEDDAKEVARVTGNFAIDAAKAAKAAGLVIKKDAAEVERKSWHGLRLVAYTLSIAWLAWVLARLTMLFQGLTLATGAMESAVARSGRRLLPEGK